MIYKIKVYNGNSSFLLYLDQNLKVYHGKIGNIYHGWKLCFVYELLKKHVLYEYFYIKKSNIPYNIIKKIKSKIMIEDI